MLKDRGNKKWTAMMLTEHVTEIRDWYESDNDIPKPLNDEFSINALADDLNIAYQAKSTVLISYWNNKRSEEYEGQIVELIPNAQAVRILSSSCNTKLYLKHILKLDIFD